MKVTFTPEMDAAIVEGTLRGVNQIKLSERVGVCPRLISRRRKALGVKNPFPPGPKAGTPRWSRAADPG